MRNAEWRSRASERGPTQAIRSPSIRTAASCNTSRSANSRPRRARAGPRHVTIWLAPTSSVLSRPLPPPASGAGSHAGGPRVAPDDHGRTDLAPPHQLVQRATELRPFPLTQPADAGGQALERHPLLREPDPAAQVLVLGEELEHQAVGAVQVGGVARKRHPPERPLALAEQGPDVLRNEDRALERVGDPGVPLLRPDVGAVIEGERA